MSGAAKLLRERHRANVRPRRRRTKAEYADTMRRAALSTMRLPGLDHEGVENASALLDLVGEMYDHPRAGRYPRRPNGWRA